VLGVFGGVVLALFFKEKASFFTPFHNVKKGVKK